MPNYNFHVQLGWFPIHAKLTCDRMSSITTRPWIIVGLENTLPYSDLVWVSNHMLRCQWIGSREVEYIYDCHQYILLWLIQLWLPWDGCIVRCNLCVPLKKIHSLWSFNEGHKTTLIMVINVGQTNHGESSLTKCWDYNLGVHYTSTRILQHRKSEKTNNNIYFKSC